MDRPPAHRGIPGRGKKEAGRRPPAPEAMGRIPQKRRQQRPLAAPTGLLCGERRRKAEMRGRIGNSVKRKRTGVFDSGPLSMMAAVCPREGCGLHPMGIRLLRSGISSCRPREGCGCAGKTAQPKGIRRDAFHSPCPYSTTECSALQEAPFDFHLPAAPKPCAAKGETAKAHKTESGIAGTTAGLPQKTGRGLRPRQRPASAPQDTPRGRGAARGGKAPPSGCHPEEITGAGA